KIETFGSRITRSAQGITSSYSLSDDYGNPVQIPDNIVLTVDYSPFTYERFFIRISNSNETVANNLTVDIYPTSYTDRDGKHYLFFDYQTIRNMFTNTFLWTVEGDILITLPQFESNFVNFYEEENNGSKRLVVVVNQNKDDELIGLEITGTAYITPPVDLDITVQYKVLNEDLTITDSTFILGNRSSATFGQIAAELMSEQGSWATYIYGSLNPAVLNGLVYYSPVNVLYGDSLIDYNESTATFVMVYEYSTAVVVISNNVDSNLQVLPLSSSVSTYTLKGLGVSLPNGYRVKSFTHDRFNFYNENKTNQYLSEIYRTDSNAASPYRIELTLANEWPVLINYLQRFKETPFAELKTQNLELNLSGYLDEDGNIVLSSSDICTILGLDTDVIQFQKQSVDIAEILVSHNDKTDIFTFDCIYSVLNVKCIQANGEWDFINVALTPFSDWLDFFGKDWSVLALNNPATGKFFERSTDIRTENLYGFFNLVSFKTQVSDFTELFKDFTSSGCVSMFSQKEVKGSDFYKFSTKTSTTMSIIGAIAGGVIGLCIGHPLLGAGIGAAIGGGANFVANSVSEAVNADNGTYYSYFYYVDGTSEYNYVALNGADHYDDTSHSAGNWFQHAGETIAGWWHAFWNSANIFVVIIKIILISAVVIIVGGLLYKLIKKFWLDKNN
ncbi:MAG: hypothetical protein SPL13_04245, partial [Clostridia bacterium]|nr:hypothetical protein [Clostridia bacterium]